MIDHFARTGADGEIRDATVKAFCKLARHKQIDEGRPVALSEVLPAGW